MILIFSYQQHLLDIGYKNLNTKSNQQKGGDSMDKTQPNQTVKIPEDTREYLESLIADAKMTTLDENMHEQVVQQLYKRLDNFLASIVVDNMSPENLDAFMKMNEEGKSPEEIEAFLKNSMPNAQQVFAQAFVEFRSMFLGGMGQAKKAQG